MQRFGTLLIGLLVASGAAAQDITAMEQALNAQRAGYGLAPLHYNARLTKAAAGHAQFLAATGVMSHTGSGGSRPHERSQAEGYCFRNHAENIAWGIPGEANVVTQWMGSSGHRRNILMAEAREFGVALGPGNIWVLVLANGRNC